MMDGLEKGNGRQGRERDVELKVYTVAEIAIKGTKHAHRRVDVSLGVGGGAFQNRLTRRPDAV